MYFVWQKYKTRESLSVPVVSLPRSKLFLRGEGFSHSVYHIWLSERKLISEYLYESHHSLVWSTLWCHVSSASHRFLSPPAAGPLTVRRQSAERSLKVYCVVCEAEWPFLSYYSLFQRLLTALYFPAFVFSLFSAVWSPSWSLFSDFKDLFDEARSCRIFDQIYGNSQ